MDKSLLVLLSAAIAVAQGLQLYILSDLRDRVRRIEDRYISKNDYKGPERRHGVLQAEA